MKHSVTWWCEQMSIYPVQRMYWLLRQAEEVGLVFFLPKGCCGVRFYAKPFCRKKLEAFLIRLNFEKNHAKKGE